MTDSLFGRKTNIYLGRTVPVESIMRWTIQSNASMLKCPDIELAKSAKKKQKKTQNSSFTPPKKQGQAVSEKTFMR